MLITSDVAVPIAAEATEASPVGAVHRPVAAEEAIVDARATDGAEGTDGAEATDGAEEPVATFAVGATEAPAEAPSAREIQDQVAERVGTEGETDIDRFSLAREFWATASGR